MTGLYSAKSYNAAGDGAADDRAALQAWLDAACGTAGGVAYLPPGRFYVNSYSGGQVLIIRHPCTVMGANNRRSVIVVGPSVPTSVDIIRVAPASPIGAGPYDDTDLRGYFFRDFGVTAYNGYDDAGATARPGRHALNFDVSAAQTAISESVVERVHFTDLSGWGIYVTPNGAGSGVYAFGYSVIRDSVIYNGLNLQGTVDSLLIQGNKLRGKNSIKISQLSGATTAQILQNNITLAEGVSVVGAVEFALKGNIVELYHPADTGTDGAVVSVHGGTVTGGTISGNTINSISPARALDGIYLQNCSGVQVGPNTYFIPSSKTRVRLHGPDVVNTQLSLRQTPFLGTPPALFELNGATVVWEATALSNGYTPLDGYIAYKGGVKAGNGTHGHGDFYAGIASPAFGSIAAGETAEYSISRNGVTPFFSCSVTPQSNPGSAFMWSCRSTTDAVILRVANVSRSPATPAGIGWTWYTEAANQ
jgi:hypothetical protein